MVVHKNWYSVLTILLGIMFITTSLFILIAPEVMLEGLFKTFEVDENAFDLVHLAMIGNCMRNIVMGGFIIYFTFKSTKILVILLIMRFLVELLDLIGGFIWNPDMASQIPIFVVILGWEIFLIYKGLSLLRKRADI
jgi:hypothetical protein